MKESRDDRGKFDRSVKDEVSRSSGLVLEFAEKKLCISGVSVVRREEKDGVVLARTIRAAVLPNYDNNIT